MGSIRSVLAGHPISSFIVLAFGVTWVLTAAIDVSLVFGLLALFGPALAAVLVARADGGSRELRDRIVGWRRRPAWYGLAFLLPFGVAGIARLAHDRMLEPITGLGSISMLELVIFGLVIGEEIGWRGFLYPRLGVNRRWAVAGLLTGVAWTLWHLPLYSEDLALFAAFAWWVIPVSIVMGYVSLGAGHSVLVATVMHGAANIASPILLPGVERAWTLSVTGALYLAIAVVLCWRESRSRSPIGLPAVAGAPRTSGAAAADAGGAR